MLIPKGALVVSCQARADNPLQAGLHVRHGAGRGGRWRRGIRANGEADGGDPGRDEAPDHRDREGVGRSLPGLHHARLRAGRAGRQGGRRHHRHRCHAASAQRRAGGSPDRPHRPSSAAKFFADIATLEEGRAAQAAGATYVATTLAGYTEETASRKTGGPDLELLSALVAEVPVPIVAEGRFDTPELVAEAFRRGAHAVVVGTAVTNPREITKKFVQAIS